MTTFTRACYSQANQRRKKIGVALELSCPIVNVISCPLDDSSAFDAGFIEINDLIAK